MKRIVPIIFAILMDVYLLLHMGQTFEIEIQSLQVRAMVLFTVVAMFVIYGLKAVADKKIHVPLQVFYIYLIFAFLQLCIQGTSGSSDILYQLFFPLVLLTSYLVFYDSNHNTLSCVKGIQLIFSIILLIVFVYAVVFQQRILGIYKSACYFSCCIFPFILSAQKKYIRVVGLFVCLLPAIMVAKRTPLFSIAASGFIFLFISYRQSSNKFYYLFFTLLVLIGSYYIFSNIDTDVFERIQSIDEDGGSGRIDIFSEYFNAIANSSLTNWLMGHGVYKVYASQEDLSAHNDFLEMFWNYGFLGFCILLMMIYTLHKNRLLIKKYCRNLYPAYCASVVQYVVCSLSTNLIFLPSYVALFAMFWAFCFASVSIEKNKIIY